jgi:hypothetical protein
MKKILAFLFVLSVIIIPSVIKAEGNTELINCSDYYKLGSVYTSLKTDNFENVSGTVMKITGEVKNDNNFSISDGKIFIRVVRKGTNTEDIVDSFVAKDNISVASKSSSPIDFEWKIPAYAISGDYEIQTYFILGDNFYMSGLPYTKDIIESKLSFKVDGEQKESVYFDLQNININEEKFDVYDIDKILKENEDANVTFTISNDTAVAQNVLVKMSLYKWDSQDKNNFLKEVEQKYIIEANSSIKVPYKLDDKNHASYYLLSQAFYRDVKTEVGIKFSREGKQEPRTIFSALKNYPLIEKGDNSLVTCFNSANSETLEYGKVISTLYSKNGKKISTSEYEGEISPFFQGIETKFVPNVKYKDLVLETKIYDKEGKVINQTKIDYQCSGLSDNCKEPFNWGFWIIVLLVIILIVLVFMIIKKMKKKDVIASLVFLFILSGMFFPLNRVNAADVEEDMYGPEKTFINGNKSVTLQCKTNFLNSTYGKSVTYTAKVVSVSGYTNFDLSNGQISIGSKNFPGDVNQAGLRAVYVLINNNNFPNEGTYNPILKVWFGSVPFDDIECPELVVVGANAPTLVDTGSADVFATGGWTTIYALWGITSGGYFSIPSIPNVNQGASLGSISVKYTTQNPVPLQPRIDLYLPKTSNNNSFSTKQGAIDWYNTNVGTSNIARVKYSSYSSTFWNRYVKGISFTTEVSGSLSGTAPSTPGIYYFPMGSIITGVDAGVRGGKAATGRYCVLGGGKCLGELGTPTLVATSNTCNSVDLTWASVQNADSYQLFRENSSGGWDSLGTNVNSPYPVTGLSGQTTYRFKLEATNSGDGFTEKTESVVSITTGSCNACAGNTAPTAPVVTVSPTSQTLNVGDTASFLFSSTDSQSDAITYKVNWGTGGATTTVTSPTTKIWSTAGVYSVRFESSDSCSTTNNTSNVTVKQITVNNPITAPTSSCTSSPLSPTVGQTVTWSSTVTGGTAPYTYAWSGDATGNLNTSSQTYNTTGTKTADLSVTDANGAVGTTICSTNVSVSTTPLTTVTCSGSPTNPNTNQTVTWSSGLTGGIAPFTYTWGGATTGSNSVSTATYTSTGTKVATISVRDSASTTRSGSCSVIVNAPPIPPTDLCTNIPDLQTTVPTGTVRDETSGICTCTGGKVFDDKFQCVTCTGAGCLNNVTCSPSSSNVDVGQTVTWSSAVTGGTSPFAYLWGGAATGSGSTSQTTYQTTGTKTANITVTDANDTSKSNDCSVNVNCPSGQRSCNGVCMDSSTDCTNQCTPVEWQCGTSCYPIANSCGGGCPLGYILCNGVCATSCGGTPPEPPLPPPPPIGTISLLADLDPLFVNQGDTCNLNWNAVVSAGATTRCTIQKGNGSASYANIVGNTSVPIGSVRLACTQQDLITGATVGTSNRTFECRENPTGSQF